jgi:hypothetical protein
LKVSNVLCPAVKEAHVGHAAVEAVHLGRAVDVWQWMEAVAMDLVPTQIPHWCGPLAGTGCWSPSLFRCGSTHLAFCMIADEKRAELYMEDSGDVYTLLPLSTTLFWKF